MRRFNLDMVPQPKMGIDFKRVTAFPYCDFEIGSGVGRFAIDRALRFPDHAIIAVEKTTERYNKFANRVRTHNSPPNLFALHAEAVSVVTHCVPPLALNEIFILYPNPYPKLRQRNLRWHNRAFMAFLLERLKPEGRLTIATNIEDYRDEAAEMMTSAWHLAAREDRKIGANEKPRTHFERKYLARDEICWNLVFEKPRVIG